MLASIWYLDCWHPQSAEYLLTHLFLLQRPFEQAFLNELPVWCLFSTFVPTGPFTVSLCVNQSTPLFAVFESNWQKMASTELIIKIPWRLSRKSYPDVKFDMSTVYSWYYSRIFLWNLISELSSLSSQIIRAKTSRSPSTPRMATPLIWFSVQEVTGSCLDLSWAWLR